MAETTHIEWADATWNPITGCTLVSEGCRHCYAATLAAGRLKHHPSRKGLARVNADGEAKFTGEVRFNEAWLDQPLRWTKPRRIFVCAHGDLFHERVPDEWIDRVFAVMAMAPQHVFIVLTKRPERMRRYLRIPADALRSRWGFEAVSVHCAAGLSPYDAEQKALKAAPPSGAVLPNVWLGVSVEDQASANERIPILLDTPATVRFISAEPLLGWVDLAMIEGGSGTQHGSLYIDALTGRNADVSPETVPLGDSRPKTGKFSWNAGLPALDWVIVGGESGRDARPMHPDWARYLRNQCAAAGVPFFFKQWGEWSPAPAGASHPLECNRVPGSRSRVEVICQAGKPIMQRVGKRAAGHLLDGVEHFNWPEAAKVLA